MFTFLTTLANRVSSKLIPKVTDNFDNTQGAVLYRSDGSVSLNLENKRVQENISKHMKGLEQLHIKTQQQSHSSNADRKG